MNSARSASGMAGANLSGLFSTGRTMSQRHAELALHRRPRLQDIHQAFRDRAQDGAKLRVDPRSDASSKRRARDKSASATDPRSNPKVPTSDKRGSPPDEWPQESRSSRR